MSSAIRPSIAFDDPFGLTAEWQESLCLAAGVDAVLSGAEKHWVRLDPSEYFVPRVEAFSAAELAAAEAALVEDGVFSDPAWKRNFLDQDFAGLVFTPEALVHCAVKFGWAVACAAELATGCAGQVEIDFRGSETLPTPLDHLFIALELRRRGVAFAALAWRWPGGFEPAIDFTGDVADFERALREHVAVAQFIGGYRLSFPHAEEKFAVLPVIRKICGDQWHVEIGGMAWLEALRLLARTAPATFRNLLTTAQEHFVFDKLNRSLSTTEEDIRFLPDVSDAELEPTFLDDPRGRQLLQVTARSLLAEPALADVLRATVAAHESAYRGLVEARLGRHLRALTGGETAT